MSIRSVLIFLMCLQAPYVSAVTLVYNLRVRRIFAIPAILERLKSRKIISVVPLFYSRKSHLVDGRISLDAREKRHAGGALLDFRYTPSKYSWLEVTTGLETDHASFVGTDTFHASRAGFDDVVFSAGYRHFWGKRCQLIGYGLVGLPTKRKITRCDRFGPLLGTRLYSIGFGAEASYSFMSKLRRSCAGIAQYRLIHGFDRDWFPILPEGSKIQPGNVSDVLLTLQYRERQTILEAGYNATIFTHQATISPSMQKTKIKNTVRHGGFFSLSHGWFKGLLGKPFICGAGCNISHSKVFDAKTVTGWIYGTIIF